ncbi:MAG: DUF1631 family protein, partial [Burkholderiaceae bacterium]
TSGVGASATGTASRGRKRFELLEECREVILGRLTDVVAQALNRMSDELTAEALRSIRSDQQQALLDAVMLVRENRMEIETRFRRSFADIFERRMFALNQPGAALGSAPPETPAELSLMSDDVISDKLNIDRLIGRARSRLDPDEVLGIRARLGALLERDWFEEAQHPASPEAVFEALKSALAELSPRAEVKVALLDAFEPHVSQNLNGIYAVVNERLRAQHVLPKIRPQVQTMGGGARRPGDAAARAGEGPARAGGAAPVPAGAEGPWVAGSFGVVHPGGAGAGLAGRIGPAGGAVGGGHPGAAGGAAGTMMGPSSAPGFGLADGPVLDAGADGAADASGVDYGAILDPVEALNQAMADASAGRPAGRAQVARMLSNPAMFGVADIPVAPVQRPLVASLTALQRDTVPVDAGSVLPALVERVREQGSPLDQITVEIVSMVFDYIYSDRRLPDSIKQQLLRLQVVAVKAALLDRSFFARRQHPMRRLIDRISDVGADPDADLAPGAPLIVGLGGIVDRIIAEFDAYLSVFDQAFSSIEALAREAAERRAAQFEATAREAAMREALGLAQDAARTELARRLDKDSPPFVREFLHRWWTQVLARSRALPEPASAEQAWDAGLRTADHLIWSVAPKQSDEIPKLATVLPGLIRGLNQGLTLVDMSDAERSAFFDELLKSRTLEIAAAKKRALASPLPVPASQAANVAVRLQADGSVRFVPRASDPDDTPTVSASDELLSSLRRGQHVELAGEGETRVFKLAWISPARKVFILTRWPEEHLTMQGPELAFMLQRGQARVLDDEASTLDRAIGSITVEAAGRADTLGIDRPTAQPRAA